MTVKTKLKSDDWFKSYGPMKYPLGSPLGAAILCIDLLPFTLCSTMGRAGRVLVPIENTLGHSARRQGRVSGLCPACCHVTDCRFVSL